MLFEVGDFVFARRTVQSSKKHNRVDKLVFAYSGPWEITAKLTGSSYECKHTRLGKVDKFHAKRLSPVPDQLVPYAPIDGPDHRFGQINKPLSDRAYEIAGIKGFIPCNPIESFHPKTFDDSHIPHKEYAVTNLVQFGPEDDLHWPTLWELNKEMFDWDDDCDIDALLDDKAPIASSTTPTFSSSVTPTPVATTLAAKLVQSQDKLFFISWKQPHLRCREWHLVQVRWDASMSLNPAGCVFNGKYLVLFYICHPRDINLHPRNQRWWLEYHVASTQARIHQGDYHLVRPDSNASAYAKQHGLHLFCQWVNLLHDATFVHGPFDFAVINDRKKRDRISDADWNQLHVAAQKYDNAPQDIDRCDHCGIQFLRSYHSIVADPAVHARVLATQFVNPESYSMTSTL